MKKILKDIFCTKKHWTNYCPVKTLHISHQGAIAKRRQVEKEASEGRLDYDQVPPMIKRSDTVAYALHAEVAHFHDERTRDFKKAMTSFLTEQINFYQKVGLWICF